MTIYVCDKILVDSSSEYVKRFERVSYILKQLENEKITEYRIYEFQCENIFDFKMLQKDLKMFDPIIDTCIPRENHFFYITRKFGANKDLNNFYSNKKNWVDFEFVFPYFDKFEKNVMKFDDYVSCYNYAISENLFFHNKIRILSTGFKKNEKKDWFDHTSFKKETDLLLSMKNQYNDVKKMIKFFQEKFGFISSDNIKTERVAFDVWESSDLVLSDALSFVNVWDFLKELEIDDYSDFRITYHSYGSGEKLEVFELNFVPMNLKVLFGGSNV
jgi:hypothetical protein